MAIQKINGTAFEYACLAALYDRLSISQKVYIIQDSSFSNASNAFEKLSHIKQQDYLAAANAAVDIILPLEPRLMNPSKNAPLSLGIQPDAKGQNGDVRDVLCIRQDGDWEIGLSCKHNHDAVKHSRLSKTLDFGNEWLGYPCSNEYFTSIEGMFLELEELKHKNVLWREIKNKEDRFYVPLLEAFICEMDKLNQEQREEVPKRLLSYLLGINDFYKVIAHEGRRTTEVKTYNIYGTLNRPAGSIKAIAKAPILKMPSKILEISFKNNSKTTIKIYCDNGWELSLRIHNASSRVEPSLKFDIQLVGVPSMMHNHTRAWGHITDKELPIVAETNYKN